MADAERKPLSDLARAYGADPRLIGEIERAERVLGREVSYVATNGKGLSGWSIERWFMFVTMATSFLMAVFMLGGNWRGISQDVADLKTVVGVLSTRVDKLADKVEDIRVDGARRDRVGVAAAEQQSPAVADRTPGFRFPSESHLYGGTR